MKKIIGVVPQGNLWDMEKSTMNDWYRVDNNYCKRVYEAGAIPMGLAPVDGWLPQESLAFFDGYIVQGGAEFFPYHYQIMHDAVENGKRFLGICLGEQLIHSYFVLRKAVEKQGYEGDLVKAIMVWKEAQGPGFSALEKIPGHRAGPMTRGGEDVAKHDINVLPGTILHRLLGRETMRAASYHSLHVPPSTCLTINAWSAKGDGVVEGVELAPNILGVQPHPEVDDLLPELFKFLTEE